MQALIDDIFFNNTIEHFGDTINTIFVYWWDGSAFDKTAPSADDKW
ncbi:hypothetical protein [Enterobacter hormaechei]|nr:hypothetical protein [Enterobacter hormaechei]